MIYFTKETAKEQIDNAIAKCKELKEYSVLLVIKKRNNWVNEISHYLKSKSDDIAYLREYDLCVILTYKNGSKLTVVTDEYEGRSRKADLVIVENSIIEDSPDKERTQTIYASLEFWDGCYE